MKRIVLLFALVTVFSNYSAMATEFDSRVRLTFDNIIANDNKLVFGAVAGATDSLDRDLGELYIAPFPPPEVELFVVFNWDTNDPSGKWTYNDFRKVSDNQNEFYHRYKIILFKQVNTNVTISWNSLPPTIKSAVMSDKLGGILFSADLKKSNSVTINNQTLDKIDIILDVVYTKDGVSVSENISNDVEVFPNPANNYLKFKNYSDVNSFEVFNMFGEIVLSGTGALTDGIVNIEGLQEGLFVVRIITNNNEIITRKFVKIG